MYFKLILTGIGVATAISAGTFLSVLFTANPDSAGLPIKILFFISLALFLTGILSIVFYLTGKRLSENNKDKLLSDSLKQAFLFTVWLVGFMVLSVVFGFVPAGIVALVIAGFVIFKNYKFFRRK
jgi:hypothetical protein